MAVILSQILENQCQAMVKDKPKMQTKCPKCQNLMIVWRNHKPHDEPKHRCPVCHLDYSKKELEKISEEKEKMDKIDEDRK